MRLMGKSKTIFCIFYPIFLFSISFWCRPPLPGRKGEEVYQVPPSSPVNGESIATAVISKPNGGTTAAAIQAPAGRGSKPYIESGRLGNQSAAIFCH